MISNVRGAKSATWILVRAIGMLFLSFVTGPAGAQTPPMAPDIIEYTPTRPFADYERREVMIPMRDGVKLYTVIAMHKGLENAPIMLSRTPYNAGPKTWRMSSQRLEDVLPIADKEFINDGYIRVYQDVRGLGGSEGDYVMVRPLRGPLNDSDVDHSTDAYDTIDWLVKNRSETNGKVVITGSSYLGFTALMALIDPHPALKAVVAMSPMVDGWMGDDWFHNGAFRQSTFGYTVYQMAKNGGGSLPLGTEDHYSAFLNAGSAGAFAKAYGFDAFPSIQKLMQHPTYDAYWTQQALDKLLADRPLTVPTMLVTTQWEQEDNYGAPAVYRALEAKDTDNNMVSLVIGPWRHSGMLYDGSSLGHLKFGEDTALQFRRDIKKAFLDRHLKDRGSAKATPPVQTYVTGENRWQMSQKWPLGAMEPLYLSDGALSWKKPEAGQSQYVSDPSKPIPMMPRPIDMGDAERWRTWRLHDQRFVEGRPDVLDFKSPPLADDVQIAGAPQVDLWASTSGSDSDWVVKLIDEGPDGSQTMMGVEIFRGRYHKSFANPEALPADAPVRYRFDLPHVNHVFKAGHRLAVHIQSTLFPLYDRNPQSFVDNIFYAEAEDYQKATQTISHGAGKASAIFLPIVRAKAGTQMP